MVSFTVITSLTIVLYVLTIRATFQVSHSFHLTAVAWKILRSSVNLLFIVFVVACCSSWISFKSLATVGLVYMCGVVAPLLKLVVYAHYVGSTLPTPNIYAGALRFERNALLGLKRNER